MDKKTLQIIAGQIVVESKLDKFSKLKILNFIQNEASTVQIKAILLDGKIVHIPKNREKEINDRFEVNEQIGRIKQAVSSAQSGGGLNIFWLAYRRARAMFDKCTIRCGTTEINTMTRQHCLKKCKMDRAREDMNVARREGKPKKVEAARKRYEKAKKKYEKSRQKLQASGRRDVI